MSVQFGKWNFDGMPIDQAYLEQVRSLLVRYAPDGLSIYSSNDIKMIHGAFHTTRESQRETQPHVVQSGKVVTWDGRLDNRHDLIRQLGTIVSTESTDVVIVAAAYERWGNECFPRLIGDWAVSIWDPHTRTLILSKDFVGPRHLHYEVTSHGVIWSTVLTPLILAGTNQHQLNERWIAGYFASFPSSTLTPFEGIHSVPAGMFVTITKDNTHSQGYWAFDPEKQTRYKKDVDYEEHLRAVLSCSLQRRLRSPWPVASELSGGMDSTSIVCLADDLIARGAAQTPRLDTVSYYNDAEPNWDERPYFSTVEEKRGRTGVHIDTGKYTTFCTTMERAHFSPLPGADQNALDFENELSHALKSRGNRVLLSGIGGDETMGGVPTPIPELADLIAAREWRRLARQLKNWSLAKRRPWMHLLSEALREFLSPRIAAKRDKNRIVPWLDYSFVRRHEPLFLGEGSRLQFFGVRPSFQVNLAAFESLKREIACAIPSPVGRYTRSYPYLDRDLLEFLYSIPREQLVRPGRRRSLMRRALTGIVPHEILERRRKAFVVRCPMVGATRALPSLANLCSNMLLEGLGFTDPGRLLDTFIRLSHGQEENIIMLMRAVKLEMWLRDLCERTIIKAADQSTNSGSTHLLHDRCFQSFVPG